MKRYIKPETDIIDILEEHHIMDASLPTDRGVIEGEVGSREHNPDTKKWDSQDAWKEW